MKGAVTSKATALTRNRLNVIGVFAIALILVFLCSLYLGTFGTIGPAEWWSSQPDTSTKVVFDLRLPRFLVGAGVGAALAMSGAVLQTILRNPLAEPGVIGINAGAALSASVALLLLEGNMPSQVLAFWSVFGACAAVALVVILSVTSSYVDPIRLILSGIAITSLCGALLTAVTLVGPTHRIQRLLSWLSGNLNGVDLKDAKLIWSCIAVCLPLLLLQARRLDLMSLDRRTHEALGAKAQIPVLLLLFIAAVLAGVATAVAGILIFVGLVAPHIARRLVGVPNRFVLPCSALIGAVCVSSADLLGRVALAPTQVPAGLLVSILGAPVLFFIMKQRND